MFALHEEEVVAGVTGWRICEGLVREITGGEKKGGDLKNSDQSVQLLTEKKNRINYFPVDLESSLIVYSSL